MSLHPSIVTLLWGLVAFSLMARAQCVNEVAAYNPTVMTMAANSTFFVLPIPKPVVQSALDLAFPLQKLVLLDVPVDTSLFPKGFPAGMQPVVVRSMYNDDIRMGPLQIYKALMSGGLYANFVGKGTSKIPLSAPLDLYIAGTEDSPLGPYFAGIVPAIASPLLFAGNPIFVGQFVPDSAAFLSGGIFTSQIKLPLVPNTATGPGVVLEAIDMAFKTNRNFRYTDRTFKALINQPLILPSGKCQRATYYFGNATALPVLRSGNVTLGSAVPMLQKASPDGSGVYSGLFGYSGCAQSVTSGPEDCETAARTVDPAALKR